MQNSVYRNSRFFNSRKLKIEKEIFPAATDSRFLRAVSDLLSWNLKPVQ